MAKLTQEKLTQILYNAYYHRMRNRPEGRDMKPWITRDGNVVADWSAIAAEVLREMQGVREADD